MEWKFLTAKHTHKTRRYNPNPIVTNGIPAYADHRTKGAEDTLAYHQFWEEQLYYIKNGYTTGGITVPGRYYKFVNFDPVQSVKGVGPMELHDFQLDFAYWVDDLKKRGVNGFVPKGRRKSVSVMSVGMIMDYDWRFSTNYHAAVIAGLDEYSQDFIAKWKFLNMHMVKEFQVKTLRMNDDEIIAGWKEQIEEGWKDAGTQNTIYIRTVNTNPNVLKGKFVQDIFYEECGENELLLDTIKASNMCLKNGSNQYGCSWIYGTGGKMNKGSKGFKKVHMNLGLYNCEQYYIPGYVFMEPAYSGSVDKEGKSNEQVPNLLHMKPHERVGWSDDEEGKKIIKAETKRLLDIGEMEEYVSYRQENPIDIKEIFTQNSANNFDAVKISEQLYKVESEDKQYNRWKLDFRKDEKTGEIIMPYEVVATPAKSTDFEHDCVYILNSGHPMKGYKYLDVGGIDGYDQNQAKASKSLGSMVVFRRKHTISGMPDYCPVALIRNRPKYKEQFYDLSMKLAIYYKLEHAVLVDAAKPGIIKHWQDAGCGMYLAFRPRKFDAPNGQQSHTYGVLLTGYSRPLMVGCLQTLFDYHCEKVHFDVILNEALIYDEYEIDSDNDAMDALGIAIMCALDMDSIPMDEGALMEKDPFLYPEYAENEYGDHVDVSSSELIDEEPLGKEEDAVSRMYRRACAEAKNDTNEPGWTPFDDD